MSENYYENLVMDNDPTIHSLIRIELDMRTIPNFIRNNDMLTRWGILDESIIRKDVWGTIHRELSNIIVYKDIMISLNSRKGSFVGIPMNRLQDFVKAFPTLLWILLLRTQIGQINAFRLLLLGNRLDFIEESLAILEEQNIDKSYDLEGRLWPTIMSDSVICDIRSLEDAQRLIRHIHNDKHSMTAEELRNNNIKENREGHFYYALASQSISVEEWIELVNDVRVPILERVIVSIINTITLNIDDAKRIIYGVVERSTAESFHQILIDFPSIRSFPTNLTIPSITIAKVIISHSIFLNVMWWTFLGLLIPIDVFEYLVYHGSLSPGIVTHVVVKLAVKESVAHTTILLKCLGVKPFKALGGIEYIVRNSNNSESLEVLIDAGLFINVDMVLTAIENRNGRVARGLLQALSTRIEGLTYDSLSSQIDSLNR